ncbi:hypothetical protein KUV28_17680 [Ferrimonas balearica]|nr:hypothetical protein [Ferrimonas balearica]
MLVFDGNSFTIDGVTVFADHANEERWWYLPPTHPELARRGASDQPNFGLVTYRPATANDPNVKGGGFLMLETVLPLHDETRSRILSRIRSFGVSQPQLAPVPLDSGTVKIVALDVEGGGGTDNPATDGLRFVERVMGATKPAMSGDNNALFSLQLSQEGAILLTRVFEEALPNVGVIYDFTYSGLRPALSVEIKANFKRIYDHLSFGIDGDAGATIQGVAVKLEADIDLAFEELVQTGAIEIKVIHFTDAADEAQKETWALNFFKDNLLKDWFEPTLALAEPKGNPVRSTPSGGTGGGTSSGGTTSGGNVSGGAASGGAADGGSGSGGTASGDGASGGGTTATDSTTTDTASGGGATVTPSGVAGVAAAAAAAAGGAVSERVVDAVTGGDDDEAGEGDGDDDGDTTDAEEGADGAEGSGGDAAGGDDDDEDGGTPLIQAPTVSIGFKMKKIKQVEDKTVTLRYDRQEAIQRTHLPQGPLLTLAGTLSGPPFFLEVDLNAPFFQTIDVTVDSPVDYEAIGLMRADVELEYGRTSHPAEVRRADFSLAPDGQTSASHKFFLNEVLDLTYRVGQQYHFDPGSGWEGRVMSYDFPAAETLDRTLLVNPWTELGFIDIRIVAGEMDAAMLHHSEVTLSYEGGGWSTSKVFVVKPGDAEQHWKLRTDDPDARRFSYTILHHMTDGTVRDGDSAETELTMVSVNDPFDDPISVEFVPNIDTASVAQVFLQITYSDPDNDYDRTATMTFRSTDLQPQTLRLARFDDGPREISVKATSMGTDNSVTRHATVTTAESFVFLSELMV